MAEKNKSKGKKKVIKPKTVIEYFEAGKKSRFFSVVVDKKGVITKQISGKDDDALAMLKKFVNSL